MGQFRRWRVLSVLLLVLLLCTCPITGQLSQCGMNCMIAASGSVETFCSGAFKNAESMRAPYFSCAVPAQCPDLADIVKLEADLLEHCTVYLEENRHRIGLFFFGTDLLFLVKETRDLVFGAIHILFIVVFVPIYIVHRKERMVRHKDWKMSVIVATTLVIFSVLNMFYYTCFEDLRNLDPIRIRIWASLQILSLTLSMCGLHALIIVHYLQAKVQALRVQLQTEIPVIFQYRGGEITDFAEEARQQRKSGDVQSNSVSIGARGSSIKGGRRESDEEAMRHGGESSHYCGTIVESFPGPETSPALGEISEEHHAADHAADGIARSKASRQFADSMSLTPQPIIYATQESVAQTAERLRRAIYWARPHMAWVYFIVCGIPAWGLNVYGVVYAYEKGDIIKYLAYVAMYQVGLADVLLLILGIPWLPRDNFGLKYQIVGTTVGVSVDLAAFLVNHYSPSKDAQWVSAWAQGLTGVWAVGSVIVYPSVMALIPRVQESLRFSAIDKVRRKQAQHGRATEEGTDHNLIIPRRSSWADMDGVRGWGVLRRAIGHHIAKWSSKVGLGTRDTLLSTGPLDSGGCLEPAGKRNASSNLISMQQQKLQTTKQQDYAVALSKILDTGMEGDDPAVQMGSQPLNLPMSLFSADGSTEPSVGGRRPDGNRFVDRNASGLLKRPGTVSLNPTRDLDMTLANPASLAALSQFAAHEYCVENLLFLAAAEDFRSRVARLVGSNSRSGAQYHATADDRLSCASHIMDAFITPGSMNEINLPSYVRTETEKRFRKAKEPGSDSLPGNIFDECVEHVKLMLATDIMPRYRRSRFYVDIDPAV